MIDGIWGWVSQRFHRTIILRTGHGSGGRAAPAGQGGAPTVRCPFQTPTHVPTLEALSPVACGGRGRETGRSPTAERTNAQAQRAWITDLRPIAPNKQRKPWRPPRGVGTAAASPRHANMGHDESVQMKKEHDSVYRRAHRAAGAGPTLTFAERMQADIARRQGQGQGEGQGQAESPKGGEAKTPERKQRPKPRPVAEQATEGGGSRRRQPSKRSPPRPKRSRSPLQIGSLPAAAAAGEAEAATTRVALSGEMSREEQ